MYNWQKDKNRKVLSTQKVLNNLHLIRIGLGSMEDTKQNCESHSRISLGKEVECWSERGLLLREAP